MSNLLKKIFWYPFNSPERIDELQEKIRLIEWNSFEKHVKVDSRFLDVGCGAGHNLQLARDNKKCSVFGIDPHPGAHGVGRFDKTPINTAIQQGIAENLPFESASFDTVFCSHVLEHVNDEEQTLREIKRVVKSNGIVIIGVPSSTMAWIQFFSHYFFTTHRNALFMFKSIGKNDFLNRLRVLFIPSSHSYPRAKTIFYDFKHYRLRNWKKLVESEFEIIEIVKPLLYPYPDYKQFFTMRKSKIGSSSLFFICRKK